MALRPPRRKAGSPVAASKRHPEEVGIMLSLWPCLSRAAYAIFEAGELLDTDRAARMHASGRNAEFAAVGELRRRIVQHDRRVDFTQEFVGRLLVFGNDRVGMVRAVALDMGN